MAADASGNVYFVDGYGYERAAGRSNSVFKIDPSGSITRIAGDSRTGFSGDGGLAASASLNSPLAVAVDPRDTSEQLVRQTLLGAATLLADGEATPESLRAAVTSPGGTTAAGLAVLEAHGVRAAFLEAVDAATRRSTELGRA